MFNFVLFLRRFYRGEINCQQITGNGRKLNVYLVDIGRNAWVEELDVYLPSVDLIRLPKMAIKCSLSQMVPNNSPTWDPNKDYKKILTGKSNSFYNSPSKLILVRIFFLKR